jgi:hypothetical protein
MGLLEEGGFGIIQHLDRAAQVEEGLPGVPAGEARQHVTGGEAPVRIDHAGDRDALHGRRTL